MNLVTNPTHPWVQLGGIEVNGTFSWTDGTSWDYSNWAYGKPDNHHGTENCVNMYANIHVQKI